MDSQWLALSFLLVAVILGTLGRDSRERDWSDECDEDDEICKKWLRADDNATDAAKCVPMAKCFEDGDCNGGKCSGFSLGKCDCGACLSLVSCKDDSSCGGLSGACNNETGFCDCDSGFKSNGFESHFDAMMKFCSQADCTPNNSSSCFGLPCHSGICSCT
ncbi:Chondroitin proteoglycan 3 [Toxocara canis]|uniref:Chondroitin proteoglycan 3 n=2 Tax=Toxocara canis TaxID=6265 RepID=A0A0B2UVE8_TOXCA|nr:Chondroitin proteoglycan 3 [Toxocara canis]VDM37566.1 unnamed protein product [Toxocara canis]